jgi:hypothetical protein
MLRGKVLWRKDFDAPARVREADRETKAGPTMRTMDSHEEVLLDNMLTALDRLYDQKCGAVDVQALALATAAAIAPHDLAPLLAETAAALTDLVRKGLPPDQENLEALVVTDPLRQRVGAI